MSIATELQNLNDNILDAYDAVQDKGGTVPANKNMVNLPTAIDSIPAPGPLDAKKKNDSGTVRCANDSPVSVTYGDQTATQIGPLALAYIYANAPNSLAGHGIRGVDFRNVTLIDKGGMMNAFGIASFDIYSGAGVETINFDSLQEVRTSGLAYAFLGNKVKTVSFPALTTVGENAFMKAFSMSGVVGGTASFPALTTIPFSARGAFKGVFSRFPAGTSQTEGYVSFSFPSLTTVAAEEAFYFGFQDNNLCTSIDFSSLTTVSGESAFEYAFNGVTIANTANVFPELTTVSGDSAFKASLYKATVVDFPKVTSVGASAFERAFHDCTSISFPMLTTITGGSAFSELASGSTTLTTADFSSIQDVTSGLSVFMYAFKNCTVLEGVDLSSLETVAGKYQFYEAFYGCTAITKVGTPASAQEKTVDFSGLKAITPDSYQGFYQAFRGCTSLTSVSFPSLETVKSNGSSGGYTFYNTFYECTALTEASFPALTDVSSYYGFSTAFSGCTSLTTVDFSALISTGSVGAFYGAFDGCTMLTSVGFSSLETAGYESFSNAFKGCTALTSVSFPSLTTTTDSTVFSNAFKGCTALTSMAFPALTTIDQYRVFYNMFNGCTSLTSVSFPALTTSSFGSYSNQFNNMLSGCSNVTVHFPAAIQGTIGSWNDVRNGFGGTNTTVLFDL